MDIFNVVMVEVEVEDLVPIVQIKTQEIMVVLVAAVVAVLDIL
jgi:hypothetical protein